MTSATETYRAAADAANAVIGDRPLAERASAAALDAASRLCQGVPSAADLQRETDRAKRDRRIADLRRAGIPAGALAERFGLSTRQIRRIAGGRTSQP